MEHVQPYHGDDDDDEEDSRGSCQGAHALEGCLGTPSNGRLHRSQAGAGWLAPNPAGAALVTLPSLSEDQKGVNSTSSPCGFLACRLLRGALEEETGFGV